MPGVIGRQVREAAVNFFHSREKGKKISYQDLATGFIEQESELIAKWVLESVITIFRRLVSLMLKPPPDPQMAFAGFRSVDQSIIVDGERMPVGNATVTDMRKKLKEDKRAAFAKVEAQFVEREKFIEDFARYSRFRPGLMTSEYLEAKASGLKPEDLKSERQKKDGSKAGPN